MIYAVIDPTTKICTRVFDSGNVEYNGDDYVQLNQFDASLVGMKYNVSNRVFEKDEGPTKAQLTIMESIADSYDQQIKLEEDNLTLMSAMADLYESANPDTTDESEGTNNG